MLTLFALLPFAWYNGFVTFSSHLGQHNRVLEFELPQIVCFVRVRTGSPLVRGLSFVYIELRNYSGPAAPPTFLEVQLQNFDENKRESATIRTTL